MILGKCWKWSGCPLVVLVAVPALVFQTWRLADQNVQVVRVCGANTVVVTVSSGVVVVTTAVTNRIGKYLIRSYPPLGSAPRRELQRVWYCWDRQRGENVALRDVDDLDRFIRLGRVAIDPIQPRVESGLWAPTRFSGTVRCHYFGLGVSEKTMANEMMAEVIRNGETSAGDAVSQAILLGEEHYSGQISFGYVHNAIAFFLVVMIGRGVLGSRRLIRLRRST